MQVRIKKWLDNYGTEKEVDTLTETQRGNGGFGSTGK